MRFLVEHPRDRPRPTLDGEEKGDILEAGNHHDHERLAPVDPSPVEPTGRVDRAL